MKANMWKNRTTYGNILYRKVKKLKKRFEAEEKKGGVDLDKLEQLSRMIDSTIMVQMKNLSRSEELDELAKEETRARNKPTQEEIPGTKGLTSRIFR